jgi:nucleoside-diphosphate-sugar epimerase
MRGDSLILGCGYLGRRVASAWLRQGRSVAALTRSPETAERFRSDGLEPLVGDITDLASLPALPRAHTVLYAVGFDRTAGRSREEVYVSGLEHALSALGSGCERFLYVSSTSVYGQSSGEWIDETSPTEPVEPNGQICLRAEQVVRGRVPEAIILRLAGLYGPGRLLRRIAELQSSEPIAGAPDAWLNLIHVDDAVAAVLAAESAPPGSTYLVADDRPVRRGEYYARLAQLCAAPPPTFADAGSPAGAHGRNLNKRCSNRKLRRELEVRLQYPSIEEGLPQVISLAGC